MKKFLTDRRIDLNVFAVFLFTFFIMLSFDPFCFDTITTETPLIKLGELPLLRTDFVALLFALTAIIGAAVGVVLRIKNKAFSSVLATLLGSITLILTFFDVDMLQILAPDMRISHVIMTLSRISAIVAGVSGLIVGLALPLLASEKHAGALLCGVLAAVMLSFLAVEEKLYTACFALVSVALLVIGIAGQFFNNDSPLGYSAPEVAWSAVAAGADRLLSVFALTVLCLTLCGYLTDTQGYGNAAYFICVFTLAGGYALSKLTRCKAVITLSVAAIALSGVAIASRHFIIILLACAAAGLACGACRYNKCVSFPWDSLISVAAVFIGAVVSYYVIHEKSEIMNFSANRIVYLVQSNLFVPVVISLGIKLLCHILNIVFNKKGDHYDNSVTVG